MAKLWTAADKENTASMPSWLLNSPFGDDGTIPPDPDGVAAGHTGEASTFEPEEDEAAPA